MRYVTETAFSFVLSLSLFSVFLFVPAFFKLSKFPNILHKILVPKYSLQNVGKLRQMMPKDSLQNVGQLEK